MPQVDHITLDDAASLRQTISADGVLLEDVVVGPGWRVVTQIPGPGLLRRRPRPAAAAVLVLQRDAPEGVSQRELEVGRLPDGSWEHAVCRRDPVAGAGPVSCPGGRVDVGLRDGRLSLVATDPAPGWRVRTAEATEDDVVVVFARPDEEWEVLVLLEAEDRLVRELDHRRQLGPIA